MISIKQEFIIKKVTIYFIFSRSLIFISLSFSLLSSQEKPIIVYDNTEYRGKSSSLGLGEYNDIGKKTSLNDKISSIKINKGFQVIVFEHGGFEGKKVILTGAQPNLGNLDWNDKISSMKVEAYNQNSDAATAVKAKIELVEKAKEVAAKIKVD